MLHVVQTMFLLYYSERTKWSWQKNWLQKHASTFTSKVQLDGKKVYNVIVFMSLHSYFINVYNLSFFRFLKILKIQN